MLQFEVISSANLIGYAQKQSVSNFFKDKLSLDQEQLLELSKALDHAVGGFVNNGGLVVIAYQKAKIVAALVLCKTGMKGFWLNSIINYLALDENLDNKAEVLKELITKSTFGTRDRIAILFDKDHPNYDELQNLDTSEVKDFKYVFINN